MDITNVVVNPQSNASGVKLSNLRGGKTGELIVGDAHGRFHEANMTGNVYSSGMTTTSISNATFTSGTLDATATPILGVWNPLNSGYNLSIMQARLGIVLTALQATGGGTFVWATSVNNASLTASGLLSPFCRNNFQRTGSVAKGLAGIALTGLTTSLVVQEASALYGGSNINIAFLQTAVGTLPPQVASVEHIDGAWIVPPGGVLALLCTTTPVAVSASSSLLWEEVPITG